MAEQLIPALKPCPFCGSKMDVDDNDTLYPSGTVWRQHELGYREYTSLRAAQSNPQFEIEGYVFKIECNCGAEMQADTILETVNNWNNRA